MCGALRRLEIHTCGSRFDPSVSSDNLRRTRTHVRSCCSMGLCSSSALKKRHRDSSETNFVQVLHIKRCRNHNYAAASPFKRNAFDVLPQEIESFMISFLGAREVRCQVRKLSRQWRHISKDTDLWRDFCAKKRPGEKSPHESYELYYTRNPLVPVDFATIDGALGFLKKNPLLKRGRVFVCEGTYAESLEIDHLDVTIEALKEATGFVHLCPSLISFVDTPTVRIRGGSVTLKGLKITHQCKGFNIWAGNGALVLQGLSSPTWLSQTGTCFVFPWLPFRLELHKACPFVNLQQPSRALRRDS